MAARSKAETLAWLRQIAGELATATLKRLEDTLPWYREMPPGRRSSVGLVAQAGIRSFISWYDDPASTPWIAADVFGTAPRELLRSVSLQQTLQLIRATVEVVEERISSSTDQSLREPILLYSREIAFAAADVYARAAEARGLWDARLEALVVDSILSGEADDALPSRIAALGWHGHGEVAVLVGTTPRLLDVDQLRRTARHLAADVLIGVQGARLVLVIGRSEAVTGPGVGPRAEDPPLGGPPEQQPPAQPQAEEGGSAPQPSFLDIAESLESGFGSGPVVLGPTVPDLVAASRSARAALAGFAAARAVRNAPRPIAADDLLPERALAGDPLARTTLVNRIHAPLRDHHSPELLATLWAYLDNGRSLEGTARELYVHPNTVRYRLKRITELLGWDPTSPRDAFVLHAALIVGAINEPVQVRRKR
ncbi:PucR family transcriptional regulator [Amnibacterium setariae]|uniref:PucR family transcriptional regulator n=1 Tax=Amnibacterium setariae TaxID=2306585 RepID=A0A3A1U0Y0_9MICO|nr:helix-turn-helix domain-containing protein [Amnibacterium setariae]RIX28106.1 PucR family transcriptional regulator [Amnibacterium setariae]